MKDADETNGQLLQELSGIRKKVAKWQKAACFGSATEPGSFDEKLGNKLECLLEKLRAEVDERKRVKEALRASEERYASILRVAPTGIGVAVNRVITDVNDELCKITGYTKEEVIGESGRMFYPTDEEYDFVGTESFRQIADHGIGIVETRCQRKDGQIRDVLLSFAPIDPNDLSKGLTFTSVDITDHKRADEALQASKAFLDTILEQSPHALFVCDHKGTLIRMNQASRDLFRVTDEELVGRYNLYEDNLVEEQGLMPLVKRVFEHGEKAHFPMPYDSSRICGPQLKETRQMILDVTISPVLDAQKRISHAIVQHVDITKRTHAEEVLRWKTALLEAQADASIEGILIVDENGRRISTNRRLVDLWDVPQHVLDDDNDAALLQYVFGLVKYPDAFMEKVVYLYDHPDETSRDEIEFKSGMVLDRYSAPVVGEDGHYYGRIWTFRDITDRKQAEEALRNSEALLNSIFQASSAGISLLVDRKMLKINQSLSRITGYSAEELVGRTTRHLYVDDEEYDHVGQTYKEMERDGLARTEARLRRKDGSVVHVLIGLSPANPNDVKAGTISTILDITSLKYAEMALKESEEQYRTLVDNMQDAVYRCDLEGNITFTTPSAARLFGYSSVEELIGMNTGKDFYYHPEDRKKLLSTLEEQGRINNYEVILKRKDSSPVIISTNSQYYRDKEGTVVGIEGVYSDITKRKQAEEALRQSEEMYRSLIAASPDAITVTDLSGRITLASRKALELFGADSEQQVIGRRISEWTQPDDRTGILGAFQELLAIGAAASKELVLKKADGTVFDVEVHAAPIRSSNGMARGGIFITRDITERKSLQVQLVQSQKMEAIGTLAGGIAHDFNNILMSIMGYAGLMEAKMPADYPLRSYLQEINKCTNKAANVTRSLLAFSRKQAMELKPLSTNIILRDVEKLLRRIVPEDVELTFALNEDVAVMADMTQIDQVLMNMVSNAKDAMPKGGKLHIETQAVELGREFRLIHGFGEPGKYAMISVSDSGIGIDEDMRKKIFEPFFTTKEVGKGTGLGLSIVYGIVKQHGGYITVLSQPGRGTKFEIYLPAVKLSAISQTEATSTSAPGGTETLLLAEDDADVRETAKEILRVSGYTVVEAKDGEDAVKKYMEHQDRIDLVILDVVMPVKNGKEAHDAIRKINPSVRVLFMSGYTGDVVLDKGVKDTLVNYISKPLSANELLRKIRETLEK